MPRSSLAALVKSSGFHAENCCFCLRSMHGFPLVFAAEYCLPATPLAAVLAAVSTAASVAACAGSMGLNLGIRFGGGRFASAPIAFRKRTKNVDGA